MKTTLEIGDALYREVKALSALTGRKMTDPVKARSLAIRGLAAVRAVEVTGGGLVSWNGEHRSRAKALSPTE